MNLRYGATLLGGLAAAVLFALASSWAPQPAASAGLSLPAPGRGPTADAASAPTPTPAPALLGVSRDGELRGIEITRHLETPGLGAKAAESDGKFQSQFDGAGRNLENTKWAVKKDGGDIDAIAGATITPRAIVTAVHAGLEFFGKNKELIFTTTECSATTAELAEPVEPCAMRLGYDQ